MRWFLHIVALLALGACARSTQTVVDAGSCQCQVDGPEPAHMGAVLQPPETRLKNLPLAVCDGQGKLPLEAALEAFDAREFEKALSCAAQAAALSPNDVLAHAERANALAQLGRSEEATRAYARALAIDPDSLDALAGAAHFYIVVLPSSRELDELGLAYAERGFELASQHDESFAVSFARFAAMGFNDIGQSQEALDRAEWVLKHAQGDAEAMYERAVALYELCRFPEAKAAFQKLLNDPERVAWAHQHLGLLLEREGKDREAATHFEQAHALDGEAFPPPVLLPAEAFEAELAKAIASLPDDMKRDLRGIPVQMEDLPAQADLLSGEVPLSPSILGLFRGTPLNEACEPEPDAQPGAPCRSILLYRKNLSRAVKTKEELTEQIGVTLLHEVGHLRGEDDSELAARGLE